MRTDVIHIGEKVRFENTLRSGISFKKFIEFLKASAQEEKSLKRPYFKWILRKFRKSPELAGIVPIDKLSAYGELLEMISTCLLPLAADEKTLWALSNSLSPEIFYGTSGFYELMSYLKHPSVLNPSNENKDTDSEKIIRELQYGLVLEKIYKLPYLKKTEWIRKFVDPETGLDKYFLVQIDSRFVEIKPIDEIPELNCGKMSPSSVWGEEFKKIQKSLPLDRFEANGFSVITLRDVTAKQAIEQIGKRILNNTKQDRVKLFEEVTHSLQTIAGSRHFQFGIVPFFMINDRAALLYENSPFSIIVQACWQSDVSKKEFISLRNQFASDPETIIWSAKDKEDGLPEFISKAFIHAGIGTYIMFPVFHNDQLSGIFEISSKLGHPMMTEAQLLNLRPAFPLISQLIQNLIARFNSNIENIIKEKFTSIQPAVQWKFNETAWHYLRDHIIEDKKDPVEEIRFSNLHPLYGAVDIRDSTILRNEALAKDYTIQLGILTKMISGLDSSDLPEIQRIGTTAKNWLEIIREPITTQQEMRLTEFFSLDVQHELENLISYKAEMKEPIEFYFQSINELTGTAFENRRLLESDFRKLNVSVNDFYENAAADLQQIYPCYFEKFRTDGVEYDIYIGQSITPKKPFLPEHLQQVKQWQLESMIQVISITHNLLPMMTYALETTQLLFIHPQTIEITFRKDERRFDVEGAYNIHYHIIKKRIDKVIVLNSGMRLTQPGKIALIYFDERDADEYKNHIRQFQLQNMLMNDLEELELEPLQGVNGLKALRVSVNI